MAALSRGSDWGVVRNAFVDCLFWLRSLVVEHEHEFVFSALIYKAVRLELPKTERSP